MSYLLHLSDLHLSAGDGQDAMGDYKRDVIPPADRQLRRHVLESTLRGLARWLATRDATLDAVVVTGDVAYQYEDAGFNLFDHVLGYLGDRLPAPDRIMVVPGNHDVAWGTQPGSVERYDRFLRYIRDPGYVTPLLEGIDLAEDGELIAQTNPMLIGSDQSYLVVALNSANYCGVTEGLQVMEQEDLEALQRLGEQHPAARQACEELRRLRVADVARLSPMQLRAVGSLLGGVRPWSEGGPVRMVALHHQLLPVTGSEEIKPYESIINLGEVRDFLRTNHIDLVLHGHKHVNRLYWDHHEADDGDGLAPLLPGTGRAILICSCGTIGSRVGDEIAKLIEFPQRKLEQPSPRTIRVMRVPSLGVGSPAPEALPTVRLHLPRPSSQGKSLPVTLLEGQTAGDVYAELMDRFGELTESQRLHNLICHVANGPSGSTMPPGYPQVPGHADRALWFAETVAWWQKDSSRLRNLEFTHGERLRRYNHLIDQLNACIASIRSNPTTGRAVATLLNPQVDHVANQAIKFPSFINLQFVVAEPSALNCIAYFRLHELRFWWPINIAEIAHLQRLVIERLRAERLRLQAGAIITVSAIAHISETPPMVLVPLIDRMAESDRNRLRSMASALFWLEVPDRERKLADWDRILDDWLPSAQQDPSGAPVPIDGLQELADTVRWLAHEHGSTQGHTVADALERIVEGNEHYLDSERHGQDRPESHSRWRMRTLANIEVLRNAVKAMR
jgi:thymidylate synthase/3',5'-cyclic AMP phosphodiesterase CpdA